MSTLPGYFNVPLGVFTHPAVRTSPLKRDIVMAIAGHAYGDRDTAWPSNRTIAELVGRSVGHVRRLIGDLVRQAPELLDRRPCDKNVTGREFLLPWKTPLPPPPSSTDARKRAGGARQRSEPCAPTTTSPCAPAPSESSEANKKEMNAGGGGRGLESPLPPPATKEEMEAAFKAGQNEVTSPAASGPPAPPAPPLNNHGSLASVAKSPEDVARRQSEQLAALAARKAQRAAQTLPPAVPPAASEPSAPSETPRGWVSGLLKRLAK